MEKDSENVDLDLKEEMKKFKLRIGQSSLEKWQARGGGCVSFLAMP